MKRVVSVVGTLFLLGILLIGAMGPLVSASEEISDWDTYSDTWSLTDELGRKAGNYDTVGGHRGKQVGIFYHIWHGIGSGPSDNTKMSVTTNIANGMLSDKDAWEVNRDYYWAEPLFGFYDSYDEWVYRKHAQLLSDAGVDFVILDVTNFHEGNLDTNPLSNLDTLKVMCKAFNDVIAMGGDAPQFILACTFNAERTNDVVRWYYDNFYGQDLYSNLWFRWEGKPLILANGDAVSDTECKDFFTFRNLQPQYDDLENYYNTWNWLSVYPQQASTSDNSSAEIVNVSVAQNYSTRTDFMSGVDDQGNYVSRGRSWTSDGNALVSTDPADPRFESEKGLQLQETFDRAIELNPDLLFITGWNEWKATNFVSNNQVGSHTNPVVNMCDVFNTEFSRDIEMSADSIVRDNYYNQMVENIRRFKGVSRKPNYRNVATMTIDGNFDEWSSSPSLYRDDIGDVAHRDAPGINGWHYTNETGRNDFVEAKIARDQTNIYVYVRTQETISAPTDKWMSMYLNVGDGEKWNGYNFATGISGNTASTISLSRRDGGKWVKVADLAYSISGNEMEYAIPLSALGMTADSVSFEFKFNDNMQSDDALDWYVNGDCAPNGRFAYLYDEESQENSQKADFTALYEEGNPTSVSLSSGKAVWFSFEARTAFDAVSFYAWGDVAMTGTGTLELYREQGDLKSSTSGAPLLKTETSEICKGTWIKASSSQAFEAGNYVIKFTVTSGKLGFQYIKGRDGAFLHNSVTETEGEGSVRAGIRYVSADQVKFDAFVKDKEIATLTDDDKTTKYTLDMTNTLDGEIVLDFGQAIQLAGIRLCFGEEKFFTLETFISADGENWTRINDLGFVGYRDHTQTLETKTDEYRVGRYVKFRFSEVPVQADEMTLSISEISADTYGIVPSETDGETSGGGCSGESSVSFVVGAVGILAIVIICIKKYSK